ncbi:aminotransferase class IV [Krasilnikovia sp. MM14-A1004]|uniref:aminotransferase class IV n=1 Tax=Krasilnikovia sp. MM14-A1004 TaxID=3373541 RepID=UPI00399C4E40
MIGRLVDRHIPAEDACIDVTVELAPHPAGTREPTVSLTAAIAPRSRTRWLATGAGIDLSAGIGDGPVRLASSGVVAESELTVLVISDGRVICPPAADPERPPVMRSWVLSAVAELGLDLSVGQPLPAQLGAAQEVMVCGTELEFAPVRSVDGAVLSDWPACPVSTLIVDRFFRQARARR